MSTCRLAAPILPLSRKDVMTVEEDVCVGVDD